MAGENMVQFPRSQVSINGVGSYQMTDMNYKHVNGGKLKSTLRLDPAGFVRGARAISGSMNFIIDEDGEEFDFKTAVQYMIPVLLTIKKPGGVRDMLSCVFTEEGTDVTLEDGTKKPVSFVGYYVDI